MEPTMKIEISGSALSFLYFTAASSISDSEGFFLGMREQRKGESLSDTQDAVAAEDTLARITGILEWPNEQLHTLYNAAGEVDESRLNIVTGDANVVGWYSFRRGSLPLPSVRELFVHDRLAKHFCLSNEGLFIFALVQSGTSEQCDTYDFTSKFFRLLENQWSVLEGSVLNISQTSGSSAGKRHYRQHSAIPRETLEELSTVNTSPQHRIGLLAKGVFRQLDERQQRILELRAGIEKLETPT